ncbi:MAG: sialidase family protein, partial [Bryobacteraceae bacterium]
LAAAFVNIRIRDGVLSLDPGGDDFEVGVDIVRFDSVTSVRAEAPLVLTRNHEESNLNSKPAGARAVMVKYPARGGFVPLGARHSDGSPHPLAGTGFAINQAIARRIGPSGSLYHEVGTFAPEEGYSYYEVHQLAYDGSALRVTATERVFAGDLLAGWRVTGEGLANAIPDGNDFLVGMSAAKPGVEAGAGVMRWKHDGKRWVPTEFTPVTAEDRSSEASLVRDRDGSLLFSARAPGEPDYHDARVWRSGDRGGTWTKVIHVRGIISSGPITLNEAADSTLYIGANLYQVPFEPIAGRFRVPKDRAGRVRGGGWTRKTLCLWPLNRERNGLDPPVVARDCDAEFGPPPGGSMWRVDHPSSANVQLADGEWHHVLGYRIHEDVESRGAEPPAQTGTYLEEVITPGKPVPRWQF